MAKQTMKSLSVHIMLNAELNIFEPHIQNIKLQTYKHSRDEILQKVNKPLFSVWLQLHPRGR